MSQNVYQIVYESFPEELNNVEFVQIGRVIYKNKNYNGGLDKEILYLKNIQEEC